MMLGWVRVLFDPAMRRASASAQAFVKAQLPDQEIEGASLRAIEANRWVFAVFHRGRLPVMPSLYEVVCVTKQSGQVHRIDSPEADRYRLRDYK